MRARVTLTFGLGALVLSAAMAGLTYFTARQQILHQRDSAILRQAYDNALLVRQTLPSTPAGAVPALLSSLDTVGSHSVLEVRRTWYAPSEQANFGQHAIPGAMRRLVLGGTAAEQQLWINGSVSLMVGLPLPSVHAHYFEVFSLDEQVRTLQILALVLSGAAAVTTAAGAVIGRWASGRLLRPLAEVSYAAETIAGGRLDTRLEGSADADLAPLTASFNRMADALQERIRREARFTSDVSHELRSPLTTLAASLEVLQANAATLQPRGRQALELLADELGRFGRMVDDLLEISRVDTGQVDLALEEVQVDELVHQTATAGGARGVPVAVDPAVAGTHLLVDKRRIERVLANLVANAAQYGGGAVLLSAEAAPGSVHLVVTDRGPGVAPDERDKIFERFYRGRAAHQRGATEGTGLGLSLVAEHVRLHHGRVWVEQAGGMNRFVVELPALPDGAEPDDAVTAARAP